MIDLRPKRAPYYGVQCSVEGDHPISVYPVMPVSLASADTDLFSGGIIRRNTASFRSAEYAFTSPLNLAPDRFT